MQKAPIWAFCITFDLCWTVICLQRHLYWGFIWDPNCLTFKLFQPKVWMEMIHFSTFERKNIYSLHKEWITGMNDVCFFFTLLYSLFIHHFWDKPHVHTFLNGKNYILSKEIAVFFQILRLFNSIYSNLANKLIITCV